MLYDYRVTKSRAVLLLFLIFHLNVITPLPLLIFSMLITSIHIPSNIPALPHLKTSCSTSFENLWINALVLKKPSTSKYSTQDTHLLDNLLVKVVIVRFTQYVNAPYCSVWSSHAMLSHVSIVYNPVATTTQRRILVVSLCPWQRQTRYHYKQNRLTWWILPVPTSYLNEALSTISNFGCLAAHS